MTGAPPPTALPPVNVFFATILWGAAALLLHHEVLPEVFDG